jgi:ribose 5-phosphate isomerase B
MKIAVGCDSYGFRLKEAVKEHLDARGVEVEDVGVGGAEEPRPYYDVAAEVAGRVSEGSADRGLLVCGTGMGMAIVANKFSGVYAAVCENTTAAERSCSVNDANVLRLGGFVTPPDAAREIVDAWLDTELASGWESPLRELLERAAEDVRALEGRISARWGARADR